MRNLLLPCLVAVWLASLAGCRSEPAVAAQDSRSAPTKTDKVPAQSLVQEPAPADPSTSAGTFVTSGPLVVENQVELTAAREGVITEIDRELGDRVCSGQILARLDSQEIAAQREVDEAKLRSAQAEVRDWEAEEKAVRADLQRADKMLDQNLISFEAHEHAKYKLDETIQILDQHREAVNESRAQLHVLDVEMAKSLVTAPFEGVVGRRYVARGQRVKQGDRLFWITTEGPMRVVFTVPQRYIASVHRNGSIQLTATVFPQLRQSARIIAISPVVDPSSGSIEVVAELTHPSPLLRPGMSVDIHVMAQK